MYYNNIILNNPGGVQAQNIIGDEMYFNPFNGVKTLKI